jgi:hypothetical protein
MANLMAWSSSECEADLSAQHLLTAASTSGNLWIAVFASHRVSMPDVEAVSCF